MAELASEVAPRNPIRATLRRLLRARRERPRRRRAAQQRDELATFQLMELHHKCRQPEARRSNL
jgi:hypothetical protein